MTHYRSEQSCGKLGVEKKTLADFIENICPGDVVWDVGAAFGLYTLFALKADPTAKVVAFEPENGIRRELENNLALNGFDEDRVITSHYALSNDTTVGILRTDGGEGKAPSLGNRTDFGGTQRVELVTADRLVFEEGFPMPTVVKIDTEGSEPDILRGMERVLASGNGPREIFIEVHPTMQVGFNTSPAMMINKLVEMGHRVKPVRVRGINTLCHLSRGERK